MDEKEQQFAEYWTEKRKMTKAAYVRRNVWLMCIWISLALLLLRVAVKGFAREYILSTEFLVMIPAVIVWNALAGYMISLWLWSSNERRLRDFENGK